MNPSSSRKPTGIHGIPSETASCPNPNERIINDSLAEMWFLEEIQNLIDFRTELESKFNIAKSNNQLWEHVSAKVRESGFEWSPSVCVDQWGSLLMEFYEIKKRSGHDLLTNLSADEIVEYLTGRKKVVAQKGPAIPEVHAARNIDKGKKTSADNVKQSLDHEQQPVGINRTAGYVANQASASNPRERKDDISYAGRVITVRWGDHVKRIGIDGSLDAIKDVISSAFGLSSRRPFWLEDEDGVLRSIDRDMPLKNYTLHLGQDLQGSDV